MKKIINETILEEGINLLLSGNEKIIVFGARHLGQMFKIALDSISKDIQCFCDNDKSLQGGQCSGVDILSPDQCYEKFPDATIILGMMHSDNCLQVRQQLTNIGFQQFLDRDVLLYLYFTKVVKRHKSKIGFLDCLTALGNSNGKLVIDDLVLFITEKCTLNCINCSALVPYNQNPISYDADRIIESVKRFAESVDTVVTVNILGGEPLLHLDLPRICSELSKISNLIFIRVVTNGTLVLDSNDLLEIKKSGAYFHISNYGELSCKKDKLINLLIENNIPYDLVEESELWYPVSPPKHSGRNQHENAEVLEKCIWNRACPELRNGHFHLCGYSASGTALGLIPSTTADYVDIMDFQSTKTDRRDQIIQLFNAKTISACGYCGYDFSKRIVRAVQVERKNEK